MLKWREEAGAQGVGKVVVKNRPPIKRIKSHKAPGPVKVMYHTRKVPFTPSRYVKPLQHIHDTFSSLSSLSLLAAMPKNKHSTASVELPTKHRYSSV